MLLLPVVLRDVAAAHTQVADEISDRHDSGLSKVCPSRLTPCGRGGRSWPLSEAWHRQRSQLGHQRVTCRAQVPASQGSKQGPASDTRDVHGTPYFQTSPAATLGARKPPGATPG